jgi:hypothetical protein
LVQKQVLCRKICAVQHDRHAPAMIALRVTLSRIRFDKNVIGHHIVRGMHSHRITLA